MGLKFTFFLVACSVFQLSFGQTVERNTYAVFTNTAANDSLLLAGGQIMTGDTESPFVEHGYYPLNHSLLSIQEQEHIINFQAYPNPVVDVLTLQWTGQTQEKVTVEVIGINSDLVTRIVVDGTSVLIDMSTYASGLYFVTAYSNDRILFNQKLIKS